VADVFSIDFRSKTKKANAALVGLGNTRRIVLADNLLNGFTDNEISVVMAHEMAHLKMRHMWRLIFLNAIMSAILFFMIDAAKTGVASASNMQNPFDISLLPFYIMIAAFYSVLITPVYNGVSRKLERDADAAALSVTGSRDAFITLMQKLAPTNLSDDNPNLLIEMALYDHPSISKRIEMARRFGMQGRS
jgi:STE24 endopeptidase